MDEFEQLILCGSISEITEEDINGLYEYEMSKLEINTVKE
jgi:hypothetical protein